MANRTFIATVSVTQNADVNLNLFNVLSQAGYTAASALKLTSATPILENVNGAWVTPPTSIFSGLDLIAPTGSETLHVALTNKPSFTGLDVLKLTLADGVNNITLTLNLMVIAADAPPVAVADYNTILEDTVATGNVLSNDHDPDSPILTVTQFAVAGQSYAAGSTVTMTGVGTLLLNANGSYTFTPVANFYGAVPVSVYTVTDGQLTATSSLTIVVSPVNDAPVAHADSQTVAEDTTASGNVLSNDTDVDSPSLSVTNFTVGGTTYSAGSTVTLASGSLNLNADGSWSFVPASNWNGQVPTISYTVSDGQLTDTANLTITVTPVNDPPVANIDYALLTDTTNTGNVLANDTDPEGDTLHVQFFQVNGQDYAAGTTVTIAGVGSLVINSDGSYTFTLLAHVTGDMPTVTYVVSDGSATIAADFIPINLVFSEAPVLQLNGESLSVAEDHSLSGNVLANDGTGLSITDFTISGVAHSAGSSATIPGVGTLLVNANGDFVFTPAPNYYGSVPDVTYTATDGSQTATATLTLNVTPVNDPPVANADTATTLEDTAVSGNVISNDTDIEGNALTVTGFSVNGASYTAGQPANIAGVGTLVIAASGAYSFTPAANWNGTAPVASYTITDGNGGTASSTLSINVTPVNDGPVANADTATTLEDTAVSGNVLSNDTDIEGDHLTVTGFTVGGQTLSAGQTAVLEGVGTLVIAANGAYTFTPAANWNGSVPVASYTITDGNGGSASSTLSLSVTAVNDGPVAHADTATTLEDTAVSGNVLGNDTDIEGDHLTVTGFTVGGQTLSAGQTAVLDGVGSLTIAADGAYTFTPAANWNGTVPVASYTITDGNGGTASSTLAINVTPVNDGPVANADTATTLEDTAVSGNVLGNDTDIEGDHLTVTGFTVGGQTLSAGQTAVLDGVGSLTIAADGAYTFAPAANWNGSVPVASYTITDGNGGTASSTLAINVTPVNDGPVAVADTATTLEDTAVSGNVLSNDTDIEGDHLTVTGFTVGGQTLSAGQTAVLDGVGSLTIAADGSYTITPAANWNGSVPVASYTITDGNGGTASSTLSLSVTAVNDGPVANADSATTLEDTAVSGNVLSNDTDIEGDHLSVTGFTVGGQTLSAGQTAVLDGVGSLTIAASGAYTFTPAANWNGSVPVASYTITDGNGGSASSTLSINVTQVNDGPVAVADVKVSAEDTVASGNVLTNDTDVEGDRLSVTSFTIAGETVAAGQTVTIHGIGSLSLDANGDYNFTPAANWNGSVPTVSYTVRDGNGGSATSTLSITVTPVNDGPASMADAQIVTEDAVAHGNVLANDTDVEGDHLTVTTFTVAGQTVAAGETVAIAGMGSLTIAADGDYSFTPLANWNGTVPGATYTISDGNGGYSYSTLSIIVTPVNDGPVAVADAQTVAEDTVASGNVLANDSDVEGDRLTVATFSVAGQTANAGDTLTIAGVGSLSMAANGDYSFTPVANWNGSVPAATYTVTDGNGGTDTSTLAITVTAVNDGPVAVADAQTVLEDAPATGNVLANDADVEGDRLSVTSFAVADQTVVAGGTIAIAGVGSLTVAANGDYSFTPVANWNGSVPAASYTISDGNGGVATSTLSITVTPVNDGPVAVADVKVVAEDTIATGNVLTNDTDLEGDHLTVTSFAVANQTVAAGDTITIDGVGSLTIAANGDYSFTPVGNWNGAVPAATYTISDGNGGSASNTLSITVTPVNDGPAAVADVQVIAEDTSATGNVLANDSDVEGDRLSITSFTVAGQTANAGDTLTIAGVGSLSIAANGDYNFTPVANWNGSVPAASYTATDGNGGLATSTLSIVVTPVNDGPVAAADAQTVAEDTTASGNVLTNDSDIDGDSLSVTTFSVGDQSVAAGGTIVIAGLGSLSMAANGDYSFTPAANWNGTVPMASYTVTDGKGGVVTSSLSIAVTAVNDGPVAVADVQVIAEDTTAMGNVLANDSDVEGDRLSVTSFTVAGQTANAGDTLTIAGVGSLSMAANGDYSFTPVANWNGSVPAASYTVIDGNGGVATSSLSIVVTPVNDGPIAVADAQTIAEDTSATGNVLGNDTDLDGDRLAVTSFTVSGQTANAGDTIVIVGVGSLTLAANGNYSFTPVANWNGSVPTVTYAMTDGNGGSATSTLSINVTAVNDGPAAVADNQTVAEDTVASGNVLANDIDVDGNTLSVTQFTVNGGTYAAGQTAVIANVGSLSLNADGSYSFSPVANWNGSVPVASYTISDGNGGVASSTLAINVTPINDGPVAVADNQTVAFKTVATGNVLANDSDLEGDALSVTQFVVNGLSYTAGQTATIANVGTLLIAANGSYTFTPTSTYYGTLPAVTYTVSDGHGGTATSTLGITVQSSATNHAPTQVLPSCLSTTEDSALALGSSVGKTLSVADVDGGTLTTTLKLVSGTITIGTTGSGASIYGSGTGTVVLYGTAAQINAALASFNYKQSVADWNGTDTLTVSTSDGIATTTNSASITVSAVTDIVSDCASTRMGQAVTIDVAANDTFESGSHPITAINGVAIGAGGSVAVSNGTVTLNTAGQLVFAPNTSYTGSTSFTYTVTSGGKTETATVSVSVLANHAPTQCMATCLSTPEDATLALGSANGKSFTVTDSDGDRLTTTLSVANGTLTLAAGGGATLSGNGSGTVTLVGTAAQINAALASFSYKQSVADWNGSDTLTMKSFDGYVTTTNTSAITVSAVADIVNDCASTRQGQSVTIDVGANDSFENTTHPITAINGTAVAAGGSVAVTNGTVTLNANGQLVFAPTGNYAGTASFTYTVTSGGKTETATVSVNVLANHAPTQCLSTCLSTPEDSVLNLGSANGKSFTVGDTDGDVVTTRLSVANGTLSFTGNGGATLTGNGTSAITLVGTAAQVNAALASFSYKQTVADWNGTDTLTMSSNDAYVTTTNSTSISVTAVADIVNDCASTRQAHAVTIDVAANDTFENGSHPITAINGIAVTAGSSVTLSSGTVTLNSAGQLVFAPNTSYSGTASFNYTVTSGGKTETATVSVAVVADKAPTHSLPTGLATPEDSVLILGPSTGKSIVVGDADGDALTTNLSVSYGTLTLSSDGGATLTGNGTGLVSLSGSAAQINAALASLSYKQSVADWNGTDTLKVVSTDGLLTTSNSTSIAVTAVADIAGDCATTRQGQAVAIDVASNDGFENAGHTITAVNGVAITVGGSVTLTNGTVTLTGGGQLLFAPTTTFSGNTSFTYTVTSGGKTETATVGVTVVADKAPTQSLATGLSTNEDTALTLGSAFGKSVTVGDADGDALTTKISVAFGTLTLAGNGGAAVSGNGSSLVTLSGSAAQINAALASITYLQSVADWNGTDTLTLKTTDGLLTTTNTTSITVKPVVDIANDSASVTQGVSTTLDVLANDSFENGSHPITAINGNAIAVGSSVAVNNGSVTLDASGKLVFTSSGGFLGNTSFTYAVTSGGVTETATATVTVKPVNHGPDAVDDTFQASTNPTRILSWEDGYKGGDKDYDDVKFQVTTNTDGSLTVTFLSDGSALNDSIGYYVKDASGNPVSGKLIWASSDSLSAGTNVTIPASQVLGKDYGFFIIPGGGAVNHAADGSALTFGSDSSLRNWYATTNGTKLTGQGANIFFDDAQFNTDDYKVGITQSGTSTEGQGLVHVKNSANAAGTVSGSVLWNDTDPDADVLAVTGYSQAAHGTVVMTSKGSFTYTATTGYTGADSFSYSISDGNGGTDTATVHVNAGNYSPYLTQQVTWSVGGAGATAGKLLTLDLSQYVADANGGALHFSFDSPLSGVGSRSALWYQVQSFDTNTGLLKMVVHTVPTDTWNDYNYNPLLKFSVYDTQGASTQGSIKLHVWDVGIASPIALDLNHNGQIDVTGQTTAQDGHRTALGSTVSFDLDGDGKQDTTEWLQGTGDALLVDNRDGNANGDMNGTRLFGNDSDHQNGYAKLADLDANHDGMLTGNELTGLQAWVDNGDAQVQVGELRNLSDFGITSLSVNFNAETDAHGDTLIRSSAGTADGGTVMTEDVWFGAMGNLSAANASASAATPALGDILSSDTSLDGLLAGLPSSSETVASTSTTVCESTSVSNVSLDALKQLTILLDQAQTLTHA